MSPTATTTTSTRRHPLMAIALMAITAFALFFAATLMLTSSHASAADLPPQAHTPAAAEQTDAEVAGDSDALFATPAWAILRHLIQLDLLPEQATEVIARAVLEQSELRHPGRTCERILASGRATAEIIERCRAALGGDEPTDPAQICRRALQSPTSAQDIIQRCRAWLATTEATPPMPPSEVCRRLASATNPAEELVERCRNWLANETPSDSPSAREVCRRILAAEDAPELLIQRCEAFGDGALRPERPSRPEQRPERPAPLDRSNRR